MKGAAVLVKIFTVYMKKPSFILKLVVFRVDGIRKRKVKMKKDKVLERDRISNLPDHIIVQIISWLPTKEAVRTSILSPRWKYLWKGINRISLLDPDPNPDKFANLVERVLGNCSSANFLSFELSCPDNIDLTQLNAWICRASSSKIENLMLRIFTFFSSLPALSELPKCVLLSSSLVALKLDSFFDIQIPESICFPYLKLLDLDLIFPIQCSIVHRILLSSCLVLEKFILCGHLDSGKNLKLDICGVPTLTDLSLCLEYGGDNTGEYEITIDAPNLEHLSIMDDTLSHYVVKNLSCIRHVDIMYEATNIDSLKPNHGMNLLELLKGIAATHVLTLHFHTIDVLRLALGYTWPTFNNLVMLEMTLHDISGWSCFPIVLHYTPNLKVLILDLQGINNMDFSDNEDNDERPSFPWTAPDTEPICLLEQLKVIGIKCVEGNEDELQAIAYMLNNAQVLQRMLIDFHPHPTYEGLKERILTFPRASETCVVDVCKRVLFRMFHNEEINKIEVFGIA